MSISLIVNADDFGITAGANRSILACHLAGSVTSTTLMANMDAVENAVSLAKENPSLGVGMHFNLTLGRPLADAGARSSLVKSNGEFMNRGRLLKRLMTGTVRTRDLEKELHAQLHRILALGLYPTHFDSHEHVHAVPQVFSVLSAVAASMKLPVRVPWRWRGKVENTPLSRKVRQWVMQAMASRCVAISPAGLRFNDGLCSVFDLAIPARMLDESCYVRLLTPYATGVIELMVHPAAVDAELKRKTAITDVSEVEDRLLRSDFLRRHVEARGGRMASFRDLG